VNIIPKYVKTNEDLLEEMTMTWEQSIESSEAVIIHGDRIVESLEKEEHLGLEKFTFLK